MSGAHPAASRRFYEGVRDELMQAQILTDLLKPGAPRRLAVCGCNAGAGASSIALNLALMLWERSGRRILVVDADLRQSGLSAGVSGPGFAEFAAGSDDGVIVLHDVGPGVHLMAAGSAEEPLETLRKAVDRLALLSGTHDLVIVDLPPVLEYPDAAILAPALDGFLLVLEAEETRRPVALEVRRRLEAAGARLIGAVLNKRRRYIPNWLYRRL